MGKELEEAWEARIQPGKANEVLGSCKRCQTIKYRPILDEQNGYCQNCLKAVQFEKELKNILT